jgi:hypothetical protein
MSVEELLRCPRSAGHGSRCTATTTTTHERRNASPGSSLARRSILLWSGKWCAELFSDDQHEESVEDLAGDLAL